MPLKIDTVDLDLEVLPGPPERDRGGGAPTDLIWKVMRSSAFREVLRPIVVEIIAAELERVRRRLG